LFEGEVEPVDGVEEEEGADAFVEVVALTAEGVEFGAFGEKFRLGGAGAEVFEGAVAHDGILSGDDGDERTGHGISGRVLRGVRP
jgi:hypothetical protein